MATMLDSWTWWAATTLAAASVQGAVAALVVWLLCRRLTAISPAMRALLWWVAALGFVLALAPLPSLRIPMLPGPTPIVSIAAVLTPPAQSIAAPVRLQTNGVETPRPSRVDRSIRSWASAAVVVWVAMLAIHAVRLVSAYVRLRGIVRRAAPFPGDEEAMATRTAAALGLKRSPALRVSDEIETPLVAGLLRPVVLIPASAIESLSLRERAMAIGHELAHVRRRDLLWAWVPAAAERLFFFHPLARLAAREYAAERESACDALVLDTMPVTPHDYGRMLVRLGISSANPAFTMGGSPPSLTSLKRRLDMLHDATSARSSRVTIAFMALIAAVAVLPLRVVAKTPAAPGQAAAVPAAAQTPARPAPTAKPQTAAPAAPRPVRPDATGSANLEQAIAEQRRDMQRIEEALFTLRSELETLHARQRESQSAQQMELARAQDNMRRMLEIRQAAERLQGRASADPERQATLQFLEDRLRLLTAEQEETGARLRQLSAEIDATREKLDEARRGQQIESPKRSDEKK